MTLPLLILALAGGIWFQVNSLNGALTGLGTEGDPMPWVQRTDGSQHTWVGEKYSWGLGYMDVDGTTFKWEYDGQKYHAGAVEISVERRLDGAIEPSGLLCGDPSEEQGHLRDRLDRHEWA